MPGGIDMVETNRETVRNAHEIEAEYRTNVEKWKSQTFQTYSVCAVIAVMAIAGSVTCSVIMSYRENVERACIEAGWEPEACINHRLDP